MAYTLNGTSQYISCPVANYALFEPTWTVMVRFKSSVNGTSRLCLYSEQGSGAGMLMAINDGTAGQARCWIRDSSDVLVDLRWDGSVNDGEWHTMLFVRAATNSHKMYVDGVERGSSSDTVGGSFTGITHKLIGARYLGSVSSYFSGDIEDYAMWKETVLDADDAADLHAGDKHVFNIATRPHSYYSLVDRDDGLRDQGNTVNAATLVGSPSLSTGPSGTAGVPLGMSATINPSGVLLIEDASATLIAKGAGNTIRENGNIVLPTGETHHAYMYYTRVTNRVYAAYAETQSDYENDDWTEAGEVNSNALEDPYVWWENGTFYLIAEDKSNAVDIVRSSSSDGLTFGANTTLLEPGSGAEWDAGDVSSPVVIKHGTTYYLFFEGRNGGGQQGDIGYATASSITGTFTKYASNPVLTKGASGTWDQTAVVCDDIIKIGDTWFMWYHGHNGTLWRMGLATSTDLVTWTKHPRNPFTSTRLETLMWWSPDGSTGDCVGYDMTNNTDLVRCKGIGLNTKVNATFNPAWAINCNRWIHA